MLADAIDVHVGPGELRAMAEQALPPFDALKMARAIGVEVYATEFGPEDGEDVSGSVVITDGQPVIYVAKDHAPTRQNFTIAHELGHIALGHLDGRDGELIDDAKRLRSAFWDREEREANAFAAELLMPARWVREALEAGIRTLDELSTLFGVSRQAMSVRIESLRRWRGRE